LIKTARGQKSKKEERPGRYHGLSMGERQKKKFVLCPPRMKGGLKNDEEVTNISRYTQEE